VIASSDYGSLDPCALFLCPRRSCSSACTILALYKDSSVLRTCMIYAGILQAVDLESIASAFIVLWWSVLLFAR
jgi:hypothetical protein